MNREEAANILDLKTRPEALADFVGPELAGIVHQAMIMGAEALRGPQPDPITGMVPCEYCKNPKKLMEDGYYQVTPNTKWLPDIGDLVCTPSGEYAIFAIDGCEDDTFLCQGMTTCPMCGRKLTVPPRPGAIVPDAGEMDPNGDEGAGE